MFSFFLPLSHTRTHTCTRAGDNTVRYHRGETHNLSHTSTHTHIHTHRWQYHYHHGVRNRELGYCGSICGCVAHDESHVSFEWVTSHLNVPYECLIIHIRHDSFKWDMSHSYEMWLIHVRHNSFIWVKTHSVWDMTHSYETGLIHMRHYTFIWDRTHSYETWLIHMRQNSFK